MNAQSRPLDSVQPQRVLLDTSKLYQEGIAAGTLGAVTIAVWFLVLDLLKGRPLFTPTVLGTALFKGMGELPTRASFTVSVDIVVGFTFVHWLVFAAVGCIASRLLGLAERNANIGFGILLLFVVFEFGFIGGTTVFARPVLQALAWPPATVLIGNLLAAIAMGLYFWRRHPHMTIRP
jgi:hypothetical protein